jgi:hypothetical protein
VSKSRAKKKQRQRARAAGTGVGATAGAAGTTAERAARPASARHAQATAERAARPASGRDAQATAERAARPASARHAQATAGRAARPASGRHARDASERRPSRLDERDGVARPDPPWAPFPLTEIGIAAGIALFGLGFVASGTNGPYLFAIGMLVLVVVVGELCLREHVAGFRSHSILLGLLAVTAVHMVVFYAVTREWRGPIALAVDLALAGVLAFWLQQRFRAARATARLP